MLHPVAVLAFLVILTLLLLDWWIKRRRWATRESCSDEEFLLSCRGSSRTDQDPEILDLRSRIAKELGLSPSRLLATDRLNELRDRYCLVVTGHLALNDLLLDLGLGDRDNSAVVQGSLTVADLIRNAFTSSRNARHD